jgi:hypothetical protein
MGPFTVSTAGMRGSPPPVTCGAESYLREASPLAPLTAGVEQGAEKDPADRDDESDDQPKDPGAIHALLKRRAKGKGKRKDDGKELPFADGGVAEAEAGDEEEYIGGDPHGRIIPRARERQSRTS